MTRSRLVRLGILALALVAGRLDAERFDHVPLTGFESGRVRLGGEGVQPGSRADIVTASFRTGKKAARLHIVFRPGVRPRQYVELVLDRRPAGRVRSLDVWVKGDASKEQLKLRLLDATRETFQYRWGLIDWQGWRRHTHQ
jgi:hypothetical protein